MELIRHSMKKPRKHLRFNKILFILIIFLVGQTSGQEYTLSNAASELTVFGTSNLHDWDVNAETQSGKLVLDASDQLQIKHLKVVVTAESLKSGRGGMDKNTYKALNTSKPKSIILEMNNVSTNSDLGNGSYRVSSVGDLTIAGVTKKTEIEFIMELSSNTVNLKGKKILKMTDYGVTPPKALLGTITTGDEISINFNTILKK